MTLEDDVAGLLQKEMRRSGMSFKQAVNHFLRLGIMRSRQPSVKPFTVEPRALGLPRGLSYDNVEELIEALEGPSHK